jgi:hypothetical protein
MSPSSALKMDTVCLSETLASAYKSTRLQDPEEHHHPHRRENLKSHIKEVACHYTDIYIFII